MKKQLVILSLLISGITTNNTFAQSKKGESVITAGVGMSLYFNVLTTQSVTNGANTSSLPTLNLTYDYGITESFSLGIAIGHNRLSVTENERAYYDPFGTLLVEQPTIHLSRTNIALRPMFHWGNNERLDWHAGLRLGYSIWSFSDDSKDPFYTSVNGVSSLGLPSFQILTGSRIYFTDNLGMTIDVGIGTPYFASIGLSRKF